MCCLFGPLLEWSRMLVERKFHKLDSHGIPEQTMIIIVQIIDSK